LAIACKDSEQQEFSVIVVEWRMYNDFGKYFGRFLQS
jgi:hypothetical protein